MNGGCKTFGFDDGPKELGLQRKILTVELVPSTSWGDNLRSRLSKKDWDTLRKLQYERANHRCEICGGVGWKQGYKWPVECHEVWEYDDANGIQRLARLIALCPFCHKAKHLGRAEVMGEMKLVLAHLMAVNEWTREETLAHTGAAFTLWKERSKRAWTLDISILPGVGLLSSPTE